MAMVHSLIPWTQLTRFSTPDFRVVRRELLVHGEVVPIGADVPAEIVGNPVRLRQLYEQRAIEPVEAPKGSLQEYRDRKTVTVPLSVTTAVMDLDLPAIPMEESNESVGDTGSRSAKPKQYKPARKAAEKGN